jgi:hypothetical protein
MVNLTHEKKLGLAIVATQANVCKLGSSIATLACLKNNNKKTINTLLCVTLACNVENLITGILYSIDTSGLLRREVRSLITLVPTCISTATSVANLIIYNNNNITEKNKKITLYTLSSVGLVPNSLSLTLNAFYLYIEPKLLG